MSVDTLDAVDSGQITDLLQKSSQLEIRSATLLRFINIPDGLSVYNITPPFLDGQREVLFGRVEPEESELSQVWMFKKVADQWEPTEIKIPDLQDPFYTIIDDEILFGGVRVSEGIYDTAFWRVKRFDALPKADPFTFSPPQHKDIRLIQIKPDRIGIFTRPQGKVGGKGVIAYTEISSLNSLSPKTISSAREIEGLGYLLNKTTVWGGVNQVQLLSDGKLGVLGHIACYTDKPGFLAKDIPPQIYPKGKIKHYLGLSFVFNPDTKIAENIQIILSRDVLPKGPSKLIPKLPNFHLQDVVFLGGGEPNPDGTMQLYGGASDAQAFQALIPNPFQNN